MLEEKELSTVCKLSDNLKLALVWITLMLPQDEKWDVKERGSSSLEGDERSAGHPEGNELFVYDGSIQCGPIHDEDDEY